MITVHIDIPAVPRLGFTAREMRKLLAGLVHKLTGESASLELRITDDRTIEGLNREFLGLPGPTNVLSFPDQEEHFQLGSVVLSVDALLRECRLYGQPRAEHLIRLLAHAVLHLSGLEHGTAMEDLTEEAVDTSFALLTGRAREGICIAE